MLMALDTHESLCACEEFSLLYASRKILSSSGLERAAPLNNVEDGV
jgi:hypothetical protein